MKLEITDVIADLVLQKNPELESRLEHQAEELDDVKCIDPVFGRWIDANDVKYLLSVFALKDEEFAARFPSMAHIIETQRKRVIAAIETHLEHCKHCSLKRGYDLESDARIKQVCEENRDVLLQFLEEKNPDLAEEGKNGRLKLGQALPANQEI